MWLPKKLADGRVRYKRKSLLIKDVRASYTPPTIGFATTCTVWEVGGLIKRRVRDWRRLTDEDGHSGSRSSLRKDSVFTGTYSVFPIPLMEYLIIRYAGAKGSKILDAFAGGPPRAIASSMMGYIYHGVEVRQEQIDESTRILKELGLDDKATYHHGDGRFIDIEEDDFDCSITCPPYHDLEVYSDHPDDISNFATYEEFNGSMWLSAHAHYKKLKPGAFAVMVVGNFRNVDTEEMMDFRGDTVTNFKEAGFQFWEEIVLRKNIGSAAKRSTNAWRGHKLVRIHEYALVFRKPYDGPDPMD